MLHIASVLTDLQEMGMNVNVRRTTNGQKEIYSIFSTTSVPLETDFLQNLGLKLANDKDKYRGSSNVILTPEEMEELCTKSETGITLKDIEDEFPFPDQADADESEINRVVVPNKVMASLIKVSQANGNLISLKIEGASSLEALPAKYNAIFLNEIVGSIQKHIWRIPKTVTHLSFSISQDNPNNQLDPKEKNQFAFKLPEHIKSVDIQFADPYCSETDLQRILEYIRKNKDKQFTFSFTNDSSPFPADEGYPSAYYTFAKAVTEESPLFDHLSLAKPSKDLERLTAELDDSKEISQPINTRLKEIAEFFSRKWNDLEKKKTGTELANSLLSDNAFVSTDDHNRFINFAYEIKLFLMLYPKALFEQIVAMTTEEIASDKTFLWETHIQPLFKPYFMQFLKELCLVSLDKPKDHQQSFFKETTNVTNEFYNQVIFSTDEQQNVHPYEDAAKRSENFFKNENFQAYLNSYHPSSKALLPTNNVVVEKEIKVDEEEKKKNTVIHNEGTPPTFGMSQTEKDEIIKRLTAKFNEKDPWYKKPFLTTDKYKKVAILDLIAEINNPPANDMKFNEIVANWKIKKLEISPDDKKKFGLTVDTITNETAVNHKRQWLFFKAPKDSKTNNLIDQLDKKDTAKPVKVIANSLFEPDEYDKKLAYFIGGSF